MQQLDHHLEVSTEGRITCRRCGHGLGSIDQNFKDHAICKVRSIEESNPLIVDPSIFIDDDVVFRQYFCPSCGTLLENEVILAASAPVWDKQLSDAAL